jgi:putative cell wall-binding protein
VVLASGENYPDALVGVPLAVARNAPLLLTESTSLPSSTKAEIQRVLPAGGTVYLLGGDGAISDGVAAELAGLGFHVTRYGGADRYETAAIVAGALGNPGVVLLATGTNFSDALSAGVAAAKETGAVLLTNGASLPAATSQYLAAHAKTVYAVGGPAVAADSSATALAGADRYSTAVAVAQRFFTQPAGVGVASGLRFPDALSGGVLLARAGIPLVLAGTDGIPTASAAYLSSVGGGLVSAHLFGGVAALTLPVQQQLRAVVG